MGNLFSVWIFKSNVFLLHHMRIIPSSGPIPNGLLQNDEHFFKPPE